MTATVAATKGYDALLVVHSLLAISALVVLLVLRSAAAAASRGDELSSAAARSFSGRRELAGRVVHLVPLSGLGLLGLSRGAYDLSTWFVAVGLVAWLVAAASLEAVAFPAQRAAATALATGGDATGTALRMCRSVEFAALVIVVAAAGMVGGSAA